MVASLCFCSSTGTEGVEIPALAKRDRGVNAEMETNETARSVTVPDFVAVQVF
jgi:hypothetical protein